MNIDKGHLRAWLEEDIQSGDITTEALVDPQLKAQANIIAKQNGVICGIDLMETCLEILDAPCQSQYHIQDGDQVKEQQLLATFQSSHAALLKAERTYLNLLQHLSGIASQTKQYVDLVAHTKAQVLDTRKTIPGLRLLAKHAVAMGGGHNHRIGLFDQFLIKENHLQAFRSNPNPFLDAIQKARAFKGDRFLTIEVETLEEMKMACEGRPNVILLDNMTLDELKACVNWRNEQASEVLLEASGGIQLETIRGVAETGVDRISVGATTHSVSAFDISMLIQ